MKKTSFGKRIISSALTLIMALSSVVAAMAMPAAADGINSGIPGDAVIGGTDFSEFFSVKTIGESAGTTPFKNDDGKEYLNVYHPSGSSFSVLDDGNDYFVSARYASVSGAGFNIPIIGKAEKDIVVHTRIRYENTSSDTELPLITLNGKNSSGNVKFDVVKLSAKGDILYFNGSEYKDSGIDATSMQWKDVAVALHTSGSTVTADIYISRVLRQSGIKLSVQFTSFTSVDVFRSPDKKISCNAHLDEALIYNSAAPIYGAYSGASADITTAVLDIDKFSDGKLFTEKYTDANITLNPLGNRFEIFASGANRYLAVGHISGEPYADLKSTSSTVGRTQVLEMAFKVSDTWNGRMDILTPYYEDSVGIVHRINFLEVDSKKNIIFKPTGDVMGTVSSDNETVVSAVVSFDRKYVDIYVDGSLVKGGAEYTDVSYTKIDGFRAFRFSEPDEAAGNLYVDYAVMYSDMTPTYANDGTVLRYEHNFDTANVSELGNITLNGAVSLTEDGAGYHLTYDSSVKAESFVGLSVPKSNNKLYLEFDFSYSSIRSDVKIVSFKSGNAEYVAAGIDTDGKIYAMSGDERRVGQALNTNKEYKITVVIDSENGSSSVYVDGKPELIYNAYPAASETNFMEFKFISMKTDGRTAVSFDNLNVYHAERKIGLALEAPKIEFDLKISALGDVVISWNSIGPAAKYTVWKTESELIPQTQVGEITGENSITDINVVEDATYYYSVYITELRNGEEVYIGFGEDMKEIKAELPPEPEKPATPMGQLPDYTSVLLMTEDFSDSTMTLKLNSEKCYIEKSTQTLKILNTADSYEIPYFQLNDIKTRKAAIYDFEMTVNKNEDKIVVASVYDTGGRVCDVLILEDGSFVSGETGEKIGSYKDGETFRLTLWFDANCDAAAVFMNGECLTERIEIPRLSGDQKNCSVRFCQVIGAATLSIDNFNHYETRAFISDYTANSMGVNATASENDNNIYWNSVKGCKYYTLWASNSENSGYSVIADNIDGWSYSETDVKGSRYYRITYTFDSLGPELTIPLSGAAFCQRSADGTVGGDIRVIPDFIDFDNPAAVSTLIIAAVGFVCIALSFVCMRKKPEAKPATVSATPVPEADTVTESDSEPVAEAADTENSEEKTE